MTRVKKICREEKSDYASGKKMSRMPGHMSEKAKIPTTSKPEIEALREKLRAGRLRPEEVEVVDRLLGVVVTLIRMMEQKNATVKKLKRMLFGPRTDERMGEKQKGGERRVEGEAKEGEESEARGQEKEPRGETGEKEKNRGHGRRKATAYSGARVVKCRDEELQAGDKCPEAQCRGHLYDVGEPAILIQLTGQPIVGATKYEREVLRCSACQERYTAALPEGVKEEKYTASADVAIALAKYGAGMPFHRLARMQAVYGAPLGESVQFERCEAVADRALPVYLEMRRLGAQGEVIYGDDTRVKILSCMGENKVREEKDRVGMQTTGMVIEVEGRKMVLYASGRKHAGENVAELMKGRGEGLVAPIRMGDALSSNWSGEFKAIVVKCLAHARRKFVEIEDVFPGACGRVLEDLARIYGVEAETEGMTREQRLEHHQKYSAPVFGALEGWIDEQLAQGRVEPNSSLGKAFGYLRRHWKELTQVLRVAGAPLDNNICVRSVLPK
ncbi:MAG: transposase [Blastocatellales bacterium]|nr:transposase [Blastocatellales bacterium]